MSVRRRLSVLVIAVVAALALAGCGEGVSAKADYTFEPGSAFQQSIDLRGVSLDDAQVSELQGAGWKVKKSSTGFTAQHDFPDASSYSKPAGILFGVLDEAFIRDAGYDPGMKTEVTVRHTVSDMLLVERHQVEIIMPVLDLSPTECPSCDGQGYSDCSDCTGGTRTCSSCNGTGGYDGWYGWSECYYCDGTGEETCSTCDGDGTVACYDCDGTGDAPEWIQAAYEEGISGSKLDVAINMPGITVKDAESGASPWKLKGADIESVETFTATSFVVNWVYAGIAVAVLLLVLVVIVWLIIRRIKKAFGKKPMQPAAMAPVVAATPVAAPVTSAESCSNCGTALTAGAKFCRACGTQVGNGES